MSRAVKTGKTLLLCFRSCSPPKPGWRPTTSIRWASTAGRQWSTPLAKNIAEAIAVSRQFSECDTRLIKSTNLDYWTYFSRSLHAPMSHFSGRRLLHVSHSRQGPIRRIR